MNPTNIHLFEILWSISNINWEISGRRVVIGQRWIFAGMERKKTSERGQIAAYQVSNDNFTSVRAEFLHSIGRRCSCLIYETIKHRIDPYLRNWKLRFRGRKLCFPLADFYTLCFNAPISLDPESKNLVLEGWRNRDLDILTIFSGLLTRCAAFVGYLCKFTIYLYMANQIYQVKCEIKLSIN